MKKNILQKKVGYSLETDIESIAHFDNGSLVVCGSYELMGKVSEGFGEDYLKGSKIVRMNFDFILLAFNNDFALAFDDEGFIRLLSCFCDLKEDIGGIRVEEMFCEETKFFNVGFNKDLADFLSCSG